MPSFLFRQMYGDCNTEQFMEDINILLNNLTEDNIQDLLKAIKEIEETRNNEDIRKLLTFLEIEQFPPHINVETLKKVKFSIINTMGHLKEKDSLDILIKMLHKGKTRMKNAVSEALGNIGSDIAVDPLIETLKDETARVSAIKALGEIGSVRSVDCLITMLHDKDPEVRSAAATSLGQIKEPKALDELTKALEEDSDVNVRRLASIAIGEIGDASSVPVLIKKLDDKFLNVATSSADGLVKIGIPSVKPLVEVIENRLAADALMKIGEPSVDELIKALGSENENIRTIAAKCLGKIKSDRAVKFLVRELKNNSDKTLKVMRDSIFFICSSSLLPLAEELNRADEITQDLVVEIFFDIGHLTDNGLDRLRNELNSSNPVFQKLIIRALGKLNDRDAIPLLHDIFISTPCMEVKKEILKTINKLGAGEDMIEMFQHAMELKDMEIKELAVKAIASTGSPSACNMLIKFLEEKDLKVNIIKSLGIISHGDTVKPLVESLKTDDLAVKLAAVEALGNKHDEKALSALIDMLQDESAEVQLMTVKSLKKIGDKSAVPALKLLRKTVGPDVKQEIELTLEQMEGPKSFWARLFGA
ncbi:MAG: HEAT repeat domain-containing protein [Candidatus Eremiobacterota bacterium]